MSVRRVAPHPRLKSFVRHYQSRSTDLFGASVRIALPARTEVLLEFYFSEPYLIEHQSNMALDRAPRIAAVGPQTFQRVDLLLSGRMDIFTIHLAPTAFHSLLGIPMPDLTNAGLDAVTLFGRGTIDILHDRLSVAGDFTARAHIADTFLLSRLADRQPTPTDIIVSGALSHLRRSAGAASAGRLAATAGLSERQFRRVFEEQVGMPPKLYARIVRFEAALAAKAAMPQKGWTEVAHEFGWFDQAHMDKDFRALAGRPPSRFLPSTPKG